MRKWIDRRRAGVLLHITSLPGGVLGEEAYRFIDTLADAGFSVWQFLPIGPTHGHGSPYETLSTFAGNPELINLRECVACGWLAEEDYDAAAAGTMTSEAARTRAALGFWTEARHNKELAEDVGCFRKEHTDWLDDYALFAALKQAHNGLPWWLWPKALRDRHPDALNEARHTLLAGIHRVIFEQYMFVRQWHALKAHAETRGILLFGDLPIYVAHDSADVWVNRKLFTLDDEGRCYEVAGVPPDYFSATGQRWGNPLYHWQAMQADGFCWWLNRIEVQLERMHLMRIDHFRGLESYWAIPGNMQDGCVGEWRPAPGEALLKAVRDRLGRLPFIAEDLGMITDEVHRLRRRFGIPGMKVLQFAFDDDADNPYLPHNHEADSVVYTGTHDNDTTLGWFRQLPEDRREYILDYLDASADAMPWPLICCALDSVARLAIIPMQDLLELGSEARLNTPGTVDGNWTWRMQQPVPANVWARARHLNHLYGRFPAETQAL
ncbi:MAG: 4-alpha-glucanotransferase [Mariprofundaceae bacterium]|nr:4-alpha-glucanotransferase [Mariprofundaceae bacterium]